ncbi:ArsR/SmtB family transcription factor [Candidatus Bipolaricaulota bacterium]
MPDSGVVRTEEAFPVRYVYWPSFSLRTSMFVMDMGLVTPGQALWVDATRKNLDAEFRANISTLNEMDTYPRILHEQLRQGTASLEVPEFLDWLANVDPADIVELIPPREKIKALQEGRAMFGVDDPIADWNGVELDSELIERIEELLRSPAGIKELAHQTAERFWRDHLEPEFRRIEPLLRDLVERGNSHSGMRTQRELIRELVGRDPAGDSFDTRGVKEVLAIPVCHLGAFVLTRLLKGQEPVNLVAFEAGRSKASTRSLDESPTAFTYRALADDTRLSIVRLLASGERYGAEVVKHCGLSQPTVSKHLRILVAAGILDVRREGGTKYYSVNHSRLAEIGQSIETLGDV